MEPDEFDMHAEEQLWPTIEEPETWEEPSEDDLTDAEADGDTLARIAAVYGLTVEQIETANGLAAGDGLAPGSRLVIPLGPTSAGLPGPRPTSRRRGEGSS